MKKRIIYCIIFFAFGTLNIFSQSYIELSVENDLYFLTDQYYSSGIVISYGKKNDNKSNHWRLGQEIYHPSRRYTSDISKIDYPYSGWLYLQNEKEFFISESSSYSWGLEIGVTGDASLAKSFQNFYHKTFLNLPELTWAGAQSQSLQIGAFGQINRGFSLSNLVHLTSQAYSKISSHRIQFLGRIGISVGVANNLPFQRVSFNSAESSGGFYLGTRQEYRPHDFALSGNFYDFSPREKTYINNSYRNSFEFGAFSQKKRWTILMLYQSISKDTPGQNNNRHRILNITIRNQF
tara:strand:- start:405 stop:1283 length:879 start_codon:yes stop_codon:yes gene_type:complete